MPSSRASFLGSAACAAAVGATVASLPQPEAMARGMSVARMKSRRISLAPFGRTNDLQFRVALLALGLWQAVLVIPVAGCLEGRDERLVAARVHRFRDTVLVAPVFVRT